MNTAVPALKRGDRVRYVIDLDLKKRQTAIWVAPVAAAPADADAREMELA
jgi:hypothetical protein